VALPFDPLDEARRQWCEHGWGALEAMSAATAITRAHQLLLAGIDRTLRPFELTFSRYEALVLLTFSRRGSLPLGKMGERLMVHPTSMTNTIDRLERAGYVQRVPHPTDRRTVLAEITATGRDAVKLATEALVAAEFGVPELPMALIDRLTESLHEAIGRT
jgi:DNA-binding MarR family transcriptional regulator